MSRCTTKGSHRCKRNEVTESLELGEQVSPKTQAAKLPDEKAVVEK